MLPDIKVDPKDEKADKTKEEPPWLQIDSDHWTYVARAVDGTYPRWQEVVPRQTAKWNRVMLADASVEMMEQAVPLLPGADTFNQTIVLEFAENKLWLKGRGKDDKEDTCMVVPEAEVMGYPFKTALNRTYLVRALRFGLKEIRIENELSPMVFSNPKKTMIIMPVRLEGPPGPAAAPVENPTDPTNNSPTKNIAAVPPSAAAAENQTETKIQTMQTTTTTTTTPERSNPRANNNGNGEGDENRSSFKVALDHIDRIKINLRDVISDLNEAVSLLKSAEKEQRATTKEIDAVRSKLREIQSVKL